MIQEEHTLWISHSSQCEFQINKCFVFEATAIYGVRVKFCREWTACSQLADCRPDYYFYSKPEKNPMLMFLEGNSDFTDNEGRIWPRNYKIEEKHETPVALAVWDKRMERKAKEHQ